MRAGMPSFLEPVRDQLGLGVIVFGKSILGIFLTDPATLEVAYVPMLITGVVIAIFSVSAVLE